MAASTAPSDAEDWDLLRSHGLDHDMVDELIRFKRNDPSSWRLDQIPIRAGENGDLRGAKRVGQIIGQAKHLTILMLYVADHPATADFCAELKSNRSIDSLQLCLENPGVDVSSFAPFLRESATVRNLTLDRCSLQSAAELTNAILERGEGALRNLSLSNTPLGDVDLDRRLALRNVLYLSLNECGIGTIACASLASLLSDPRSRLWSLSLKNNSIGDEAVSVLMDPLAGNTELVNLDLVGNSRISKVGWSMLLELLCNSDDVEGSNHQLNDLGIFNNSPGAAQLRELGLPVDSDATTAAVVDVLGANDANLLRASLEVNREGRWEKDKHAVIQRKTIWCHARGDLNIVCGSLIDVVLLPRILALFAVDSNANLIQYHDPPLPEAEIGAIRLGSLYSILRERPEVFETKSCVGSKSDALCVEAKKRKKVKLPPLPPVKLLSSGGKVC